MPLIIYYIFVFDVNTAEKLLLLEKIMYKKYTHQRVGAN